MNATDFLVVLTINEEPRGGEGGEANRIIIAGSPFKRVNMTRMVITALPLDFFGLSVVHLFLSLILCGSAH